MAGAGATSTVLLVTIPALLGALGTIISAYIAAKVRRVEQQTNGKLRYLELELRLLRQELDSRDADIRSGV